MNIHFSASEHDEAKTRLKQLTDRYGQTDLPNATHIVALGGDGHMLNVLHETMSSGLPVFGMNCGHLGFLMNHYASAELPERVAAAEAAAEDATWADPSVIGRWRGRKAEFQVRRPPAVRFFLG